MQHDCGFTYEKREQRVLKTMQHELNLLHPFRVTIYL
jgi:hypothetical protein